MLELSRIAGGAPAAFEDVEAYTLINKLVHSYFQTTLLITTSTVSMTYIGVS